MTKQVIHPVQAAPGATLCTTTDHALQTIYPGMAFFYREKLDGERLARSLARVLNNFPTFAGRLSPSRDDLLIEHDSGGATFEVVVDDQATLQTLIDAAKAGRVERLCPAITKLRVLAAKESMLLVRLTITPDGSSVGVLWNHCAGDLHSMMLLMRAWALAYRGLPHETPASPLDRDAYLSAQLSDLADSAPAVRLFSTLEVAEFAHAVFRRSQRVHFDFSQEQLAAMRDAVPGPKSVTANDAMCARLFWTIRKLQRATTPSNLCLTVNYRKRVGIPAEVIGNMVAVIGQPVSEADNHSGIALALRTQLEQFATHHLDYHATKREFAAHPGRFKRGRLFSRHFQPGRGHLLVSNWVGFGTYDLVFETTRPIQFVSLTTLPAWFAVVYDRPDNAGISVTVALPPPLAQQLDSAEGRALLFGSQGQPGQISSAPPLASSNSVAAP